MLTHAPFCPNRECSHHRPEWTTHTSPHRWYSKDGTYTTQVRGGVQRFVCRDCGTKFSTQTFSLDYGVKKKLPYREIFNHITSSGSGIRALGRLFGVTDKVITHRIGRLARQALALQAALRDGMNLQEDLVADGFESFTQSHYFPNNIHLLIGKESQYCYGADYAHIARKGRMSDCQKRRRDTLYALFPLPPGDVTRSFSRLVSHGSRYLKDRTSIPLRFFTDEKQEYRRVLAGRNEFRHLLISSRRQRDLRNDLFAVNYFDRELRKDQSNHVRESVMFSRDVNNCMERLWLYTAYHNYRKPYRIAGRRRTHRTHGEVAGILTEEISKRWKSFFTQRCFFSHLRLTESERLTWFRGYVTPWKRTGAWCPDYVAA